MSWQTGQTMALEVSVNQRTPDLNAVFEDEHARLEFSEAWWDLPHFGRPVIQITEIACKGDPALTTVVTRLLEVCRARNVALVSCRMGVEQLPESMLLERHEFRHIEVVLHPELRLGRSTDKSSQSICESRLAGPEDLPKLEQIARTAFVNERFYVDPRISRSIAASRYVGWMKSALTHDSQRLHAILHQGQVVGFFVIERRADGVCYWHLNAISPDWHGRGIGKAAWQRMVNVAQVDGCVAVQTCIAVRNVKVMNLYASLGFKFTNPAMTLHWIP